MNKVELLAPAGDLFKLKIAYLYGADAVYVGGHYFSLRARASNFSREDLKEASAFSKALNKKLYVTMNIVCHDEDLVLLDDYLKFLTEIKVNGVIVTSLYIADFINKNYPNLELHLSTQMSVYNYRASNYFLSKGFKRVVLAREMSLEEIKEFKDNSNLSLEVFIHGGMCVSFSGRCTLSNHLTNRDANRGGCAHSCRWNYFFDNSKLNFGSKDLQSIKHIENLIEIGIDSLKIEGRMKSIYYIACIVKTYRCLIDDIYNRKEIDYNYYGREIMKAEARIASDGFLINMDADKQLFDTRVENIVKDFLGLVLDYDEENKMIIIEQRNYFKKNDEVEFFGPNINNLEFMIPDIYNQNLEILECARHPLQIIKFNFPQKLDKYTILRLRKGKNF